MPRPPTPMLSTSYEEDGYDLVRRGRNGWNYIWFESWGSGPRATWTVRGEVGRPPTPHELRSADYIVYGIRYRGHVTYKTRLGGIPL
jgi:hypothetical protein